MRSEMNLGPTNGQLITGFGCYRTSQLERVKLRV